MNTDEYTDPDELYDLRGELETLLKQHSSPEETEARAYKLVEEVKKSETSGMPVYFHFIEWIMSVEEEGKSTPYLRGIKNWYAEFQPDVLNDYENISDYEINILFDLLGELAETPASIEQ